ncbi:MAG TPA: hypothetical protein VJT31_36945 [Rugosimonospora sp.]|nr:hypothetical protein [Rugosimonospora sp.]
MPASAGTTGTGTGVAGTAQQPGAVVTGAVAAQAAAAALRAVPGATVVRVQLAADGGGYDVYLREQDGTTTLVTLDRNFVVRAVESDVGSDVGVVPGPQQTDHQDEPDTSDQPQDGGFPN